MTSIARGFHSCEPPFTVGDTFDRAESLGIGTVERFAYVRDVAAVDSAAGKTRGDGRCGSWFLFHFSGIVFRNCFVAEVIFIPIRSFVSRSKIRVRLSFWFLVVALIIRAARLPSENIQKKFTVFCNLADVRLAKGGLSTVSTVESPSTSELRRFRFFGEILATRFGVELIALGISSAARIALFLAILSCRSLS